MGPRAHQSKKELSTYNGRVDCTLQNITPLTSNSFDLPRSGHTARRILGQFGVIMEPLWGDLGVMWGALWAYGGALG